MSGKLTTALALVVVISAIWLGALAIRGATPSYGTVAAASGEQAGVASTAALTATDPVTVRVAVGITTVVASEVFSFGVWIDAGSQQVAAVDLGLDFDPALLEVVDKDGNLLTSNALTPGSALPVILGGRNSANNGAGTVDFSAGMVPGGQAASQSFLLASGYLRARRTMTDTVAVVSPHYNAANPYDNRNVVMSDPLGNRLSGAFRSATILVAGMPELPYRLFMPLIGNAYGGSW